MAINEVNMMFRADRRMDKEEVALTAKRIVNTYWYLKPEDIKKCFNAPRPKQFVLEGDSFLSWIAEYDLKRDIACEDDAQNGQKKTERVNAVSWEEYLKSLNQEQKARLEQFIKRCKAVPTEEAMRRKREKEFVFMTKYRDNLKKGIKPQWQRSQDKK